jgi:Arc-like DNA binding domain
VNQAQDVMMMTVKVPSDVRKKLEEWAADNVSSMNAELVRCARDRIAREKASAR